jgi:hypothetical protein
MSDVLVLRRLHQSLAISHAHVFRAQEATSLTSNNVTASSLAVMTRSRFRRLSPEEMANKRKKGECYTFVQRSFPWTISVHQKEYSSWN